MWSSFKSHIGFGGDSDDEDLANAEIDEELKAAMDIPLYNDEAKYFLADYHQIRSLPFKNVRLAKRSTLFQLLEGVPPLVLSRALHG